MSTSPSPDLIIHTDGGARGNPGPAAIGFVIKSTAGKTLHQQGHTIGHATNNQAEYQAVIAALKWLQTHPVDQAQLVHFFLDSQLVVNQLSGIYRIKQSHLHQLFLDIRQLEAETGLSCKYHYVPRSQNSTADALLNQALDQA